MRVLLVKLSSMGDIIHTLPAITDAFASIPGISFTWVVEEGFQEIAQWHPAVTKVISIALRKRKYKQIFAAIKDIRSEHYDLVIDAQGLIKSAVVARLSRATSRAGYDKNSSREAPASMLYNKKIAVATDEHAILRMRQLFAQALGYNIDPEKITYGILWNKLIASQNNTRPYLVFLHGTTWDSKHWNDRYWVELANLVSSHGFDVQVTWATDQQKQRAQMLADLCKNVTMLPHLTINQAANVLYNSRGVVAVDTGFAHLAAALEKPMVAIYGSTDITKSGTSGNSTINLSSKFHCAPCMQRSCALLSTTVTTPPCYQEISPQLVWQNLTTMIANV